ncbi:MAG TPA: peptidylprolyl isomerase [Bacteriovoracaceae bacterium]|nr:peptidylprolyl isomerase [Bacteriovoracaceae bacterium]
MSRVFALILFSFLSSVIIAVEPSANPVVVVKTSSGEIEIELYQDKAPITVKNFLNYVQDGHYNGTIFHRVISTFMIQGGGLTADMKEKTTKAPIKNEATNGLSNEVATVAMARTSVVDSATSQFFINVADNVFLNHRDNSDGGFGYAVFGKVKKGMDVVNRIKLTKTGQHGAFSDVPVTPIVIESISLKK